MLDPRISSHPQYSYNTYPIHPVYAETAYSGYDNVYYAPNCLDFTHFIPAEDISDWLLNQLCALGKLDVGAWATDYLKSLNRQELVLDETEFKLLWNVLSRSMKIHGAPYGRFNMVECLQKVFGGKIGSQVHAYYAGDGVTQSILQGSYLSRFSAWLTEGQFTYMTKEIGLEAAENKHVFQVALINSSGSEDELDGSVAKVSTYIALKTLGRCITKHDPKLVDSHTIPPYFSRVSWTADVNDPAKKYELVSIAISSGNFYEKVHIPLDPILEHFNKHLFSHMFHIPICPILEDDNFQGFIDYLTHILHLPSINTVNKDIFPVLMTLISMGRRDYGNGFKEPQQGKDASRSMVWQIVHKFIVGQHDESTVSNVTSLILNYFKNREGSFNPKMSFAIIWNTCLSLREHVSSESLDLICDQLLSRDDSAESYSIFALMRQGILEYGLSVEEVVQMHQCFALLALGSKRPLFNHAGIRIILTKHEGLPAIRIQEDGYSIFLRMDPLQGYHTCVKTVAGNTHHQKYLKALFDAYMPLNTFYPNEGSQLSPYHFHLKNLLYPLQEAIYANTGVQNDFLFCLNFYLLATCQTCIPEQLYLEALIHNFPVVHANVDEKKQVILTEQIHNLLVFSNVPWGTKLFEKFAFHQKQYSPLQSWILALAGIQSSHVYASYLWKESPFVLLDESCAMQLIKTMRFASPHYIFDILSKMKLGTFKNVSECYSLVLELASTYQKLPIDQIVKFLEVIRHILENTRLNRYLKQFENESHFIFGQFLNTLCEAGHLTFAHEFLLFLVRHKIIHSTRHEIWTSLLEKTLQKGSIELSVTLWNEGRDFQVWKPIPRHFYPIVDLATRLIGTHFHKDQQKMINLICKTSPLPDAEIYSHRLRSLVQNHIRNGGKVVVSASVPSSYMAYLSEDDKMDIQLNALKQEIDSLHVESAAASIQRLASRCLKNHSEELKKIVRQFFSTFIAEQKKYQNKRILQKIQGIILSPDIQHLQIEQNEKVTWIFTILQNLSKKDFLMEFNELLSLLLDEVLPDYHRYPIQTEFCLDTLLEYSDISRGLKETLQVRQLHLINYSLSLGSKDKFSRLIQNLIMWKTSQGFLGDRKKHLYDLSIETLQKSDATVEEVLGFHHLWKAVVSERSMEKHHIKVIEELIKTLTHYANLPFASFWGDYICKHFVELNAETVQALILLGNHLLPADENGFKSLLISSYDKKMTVEASDCLIWEALLDVCMEKKNYGPIYHLISLERFVVRDNFKTEYSKALLNALKKTSQVDNILLSAYIKLIAAMDTQKTRYWMDLIKKVSAQGSRKIKEQLVDIFKEIFIRKDRLKTFPKTKFACLNEIFPLIEKSRLFSVELWIKDPDLAAFLEVEELQAEKKEFYERLYKLGHNKGLILPEYANGDNVEYLIDHPVQEMVIKAFQILKQRFEGQASLEDEQNLLTILKKSCMKGFASKKLIPKLVELIEVYMKGKEFALIDPIFEVCCEHSNSAIRDKMKDTFPHFLASQKSKHFTFILKRVQELSNSGHVLFQVLHNDSMHEAFPPDQLDELFVRAITARMVRDMNYENAEFFYAYFLKFKPYPAEKALCLEAFGKFMLAQRKLNSDTFNRYFSAYLVLWIKQFPEQKKIHELALLDENPISDFLDSSVSEKVFEFCKGVFNGITFEFISKASNQEVILKHLKSVMNILLLMFENTTGKKKGEYLKILHGHLDKYFFCYLFGNNVNRQDYKDIITSIDLDKISASIYYRLRIFFFEGQEIAHPLNLENKKKAECVVDLIKLLTTHPNNYHFPMSLRLFTKFETLLIQENVDAYLSCFQVIWKDVQTNKLSFNLLARFSGIFKKWLGTSNQFSGKQKGEKLIAIFRILSKGNATARLACLDLFVKFGKLFLKSNAYEYLLSLKYLLKNLKEDDNSLVNAVVDHLKNELWLEYPKEKMDLLEEAILIYLDQPDLSQIKRSLLLMHEFESLLINQREDFYLSCTEKIASKFNLNSLLKGHSSAKHSSHTLLKYYVCLFGKWPEFDLKGSHGIAEEERAEIVVEILSALLEKKSEDSLKSGMAILKEFGSLVIEQFFSRYREFFDVYLNIAHEEKAFVKPVIDLFICHGVYLVKAEQKTSIELFSKVLELMQGFLEQEDFFEKGTELFKKTLSIGLFSEHFAFFYAKMRVFGNHMFSCMKACQVDQIRSVYKHDFLPLLFLEIENYRVPTMNLKERVQRIEEMTYWMNTFASAFSLSQNVCKTDEFESRLQILCSFIARSEEGTQCVEELFQYLENKLLFNLVYLAIGSASDRFPVSYSFYMLQYIQEVLKNRSVEERDQYGYQLLYDCYQVFWDLLKTKGFFEFNGSPLIQYFIKIFFFHGEELRDLYGSVIGTHFFSKLTLQIAEVIIKARDHLKDFDAFKFRAYYLEFMTFLFEANEKGAFLGQSKELYRLVDQAITMLVNEDPHHSKIEEMNVMLFYRCIVLLISTIQSESPDINAHPPLLKLTAFMMEKNLLGFCMPALRSSLNVKIFVENDVEEIDLHAKQSNEIVNILVQSRALVNKFNAHTFSKYYVELFKFIFEANEKGAFKETTHTLYGLLDQFVTTLINENGLTLDMEDAKSIFNHVTRLIASIQKDFSDVDAHPPLLNLTKFFIGKNLLRICISPLKEYLQQVPIFEEAKVVGFRKI